MNHSPRCKEQLRRLRWRAPFCRCSLYPVHEIDPGMDSSRDEGEQRLRRVRALLRLSAKTPGLNAWSPVIAARCPPPWDSLKGPATEAQLSERVGVMESLLTSQSSSNHAWRGCSPRCNTELREIDSLDEISTQMCVPIS